MPRRKHFQDFPIKGNLFLTLMYISQTLGKDFHILARVYMQ